MAWTVEDAVEHGWIDNTVEGTVTGKIWLRGRDEPLILSLNGDCWRDLAGTRLEFENPEPQFLADVQELDTDQTGIIGDVTASRKAKVPTIPESEIESYYKQEREIPFNWRNTLYLEWFSEINGRVLIESADFKLSVSDAEWEMDGDAEEAQKLANLNAMRDFMAQVIQRKEPSDGEPSGVAKTDLDEFEWEERLKESDRLTDAYQEVLEKYMDDEDSEQKEAFVMGWDGLLDALADRDESGEEEDDYNDDEPYDDDGDEEEEDDGFVDLGIYGSGDFYEDEDDEEREAGEKWREDSHPVQMAARDLTILAMTVLEGDGDPESPTNRLIENLMQVSGKLAAALHGRGSGFEPEAGFVLAVLKRCLNWINEALGACGELIEAEGDEEQGELLESVRSETLRLRDGIIELRRELKQS